MMGTGEAAIDLLLIRHGPVASHRGDVALTEEGRVVASEAGRRLARRVHGPLFIMTSHSLRARQTAAAIEREVVATCPDMLARPTLTTPGLRNPDLYIVGERVEMVSTAEAFAQQVTANTSAACAAHPFYGPLLSAADRVGWWLHHEQPPGEDRHAVAVRLESYARSLAEGTPRPLTVLGVTHSPVLRAVGMTHWGEDPGEPGFLSGYRCRVRPNGYAEVTPAAL
jgi:broad specificity phosphatase PhoE